MISVLILTKNEEQDLPGCLASVSWCDDVHLFDSLSTDRTVEIAKAAGAQVTVRAFDSYANQRNAALRTCSFRYPWLLILDADERLPSDALPVMHSAVRSACADVAGFRLRRRDFLYGRWLKHAAITPFYLRLVRHAHARYEREINEVMMVDGIVSDVPCYFDHYPFSKGVAHWVAKHNIYSTMEAAQALRERSTCARFSLREALFSSGVERRRFHQKGLFYQMPARPFFKLVYMLLWRRAFLDGRAGVTYAVLQAIYEYFIVLKEREIKVI